METRDSGDKIRCVADGYEHDRRDYDFLKREVRRDLRKAAIEYAMKRALCPSVASTPPRWTLLRSRPDR